MSQMLSDQPPGVKGEPRRLTIAAALALAVTTPIVTWWVIGDLSTTHTNPDYLLRSPSMSQASEQTIGFISLVIWIATVVALLFMNRSASRRAWLPVLCSVVVVGVILGAVFRVLTAGVVGANIGGGLVLFLAIPVVLGLVVFALIRSMRLLAQDRVGRR